VQEQERIYFLLLPAAPACCSCPLLWNCPLINTFLSTV
jgi:hypothetical protein